MTSHTPGPWHLAKVHPQSLEGYGHHVFAPGFNVLVQMADPDEELATARVIRAAPDLLAALRDIVTWADKIDWSDCNNNQPREIEHARAVITKATRS